MQHGTDLAYLQEMAQRYGYVFYVEPGPAPFTNTAYWGPPMRVGLPQPAITVNMGAETNVDGRRSPDERPRPETVSGQVHDSMPWTDDAGADVRVGAAAACHAACDARATSRTSARRSSRDIAEPNAIAGVRARAGQTDATSDAVSVEGELDTLRTATCSRHAASSGFAASASSYDGLYYVKRSRTTQAGLRTSSASRSPARGTARRRRWCGRDRSFFGKYRGKVENNIDPLMEGRVQVSGAGRAGRRTLSWAMPCVAVRAARASASSRSRRSVRTCGSSSRAATPTTRSGPAASGARGEMSRRPPAVPQMKVLFDRLRSRSP